MSEQSSQQQGSPLQSERGRTTVQKPVVSQVVGLALQEIEGIRMGSGSSPARGGDSGGASTQGVSVEVGQEEAAIDLTMMTEYGRSITEVTEVVRNTLTNRVENLVGLQVKELNIRIVNVFFPEQGQDQGRDLDQEQSQQRQEGGSQQ